MEKSENLRRVAWFYNGREVRVFLSEVKEFVRCWERIQVRAMLTWLGVSAGVRSLRIWRSVSLFRTKVSDQASDKSRQDRRQCGHVSLRKVSETL
jgi:hypothetical protein